MVGRCVGRPLSGPWLAREKARAILLLGVRIRSQTPPDQLAERNAERFGLVIRASAQFIGKQDGGAMHMALLAFTYVDVNFALGEMERTDNTGSDRST